MISFQGTDNTLWVVNTDGSDLHQVGGFECGSTPTVYGDFLFFQGTDNKLWRCAADGSNGINLGGAHTASAPFVCATGVYFEFVPGPPGSPGPSLLCRVNLDGTGLQNIGGNQCKGTPYVFGPYVFFRGSDDKLWRIRIDGTGGINLGLNKTADSPVATDEYVFFRGNDDRLLRVNLDGSGGLALGSQQGEGWKTASTPCVAGNVVYFRGTDDTLWKTHLDGNGGVALGTDPHNPWKTKSTPVVDTSTNLLYFQGTDNALWRTDLAGHGGVHLGGLAAASTPFVAQPGNQPLAGPATLSHAPLLLVYAPPGNQAAASANYVEYTSDSLAGTTSSIAQSFNETFGVTASFGFGTPAGPGGGNQGTGGNQGSGGSQGSGAMPPDSGGFTVTYSNTTTNTSTFDVKQDRKNDIKLPSPNDGIDHDNDLIFIVLSPKLNVIVDPHQNLTWNLDLDADNGGIVYLRMDWLANPTLFAQVEGGELLDRCTHAGMTPTDFQALLDLNPRAQGKPIDPLRYVEAPDITISYEPAGVAKTYSLTTTVTNIETHQTSQTLGINLTGSESGWLSPALKLTGALTWTLNWTDTTTTTNADTQTSIASIAGPSAAYEGSSNLVVYWDALFGTFMFYLKPDRHYSPVLTNLGGLLKNGGTLVHEPPKLAVDQS